MSLTAVIVTYNRLAALQNTVRHTLAETVDAVVVVNNASTDGTKAWLDEFAAQEKRLIVVHLATNQGGAGGFAQGIRVGLAQTNSDWLVLYDDDAYPKAGAFNAFSVLDKNFDAAAAAVYQPDGAICEMNRPSFNPFWHAEKFKAVMRQMMRFQNPRQAFHITDQQYCAEQAVKIDSSSFVGLFMQRSWAEKMPTPDPRLFIYGDDILYTLNLTAAGGRHCFLPAVSFIHDTKTMAQSVQFYRPRWKSYFHYRNLMLIYRLAAGKWFYAVAALKIAQWSFSCLRHRQGWALMTIIWQASYAGITRNLSASPQEIIKRYQHLD